MSLTRISDLVAYDGIFLRPGNYHHGRVKAERTAAFYLADADQRNVLVAKDVQRIAKRLCYLWREIVDSVKRADDAHEHMGVVLAIPGSLSLEVIAPRVGILGRLAIGVVVGESNIVSANELFAKGHDGVRRHACFRDGKKVHDNFDVTAMRFVVFRHVHGPVKITLRAPAVHNVVAHEPPCVRHIQSATFQVKREVFDVASGGGVAGGIVPCQEGEVLSGARVLLDVITVSDPTIVLEHLVAVKLDRFLDIPQTCHVRSVGQVDPVWVDVHVFAVQFHAKHTTFLEGNPKNWNLFIANNNLVKEQSRFGRAGEHRPIRQGVQVEFELQQHSGNRNDAFSLPYICLLNPLGNIVSMEPRAVSAAIQIRYKYHGGPTLASQIRHRLDEIGTVSPEARKGVPESYIESPDEVLDYKLLNVGIPYTLRQFGIVVGAILGRVNKDLSQTRWLLGNDDFSFFELSTAEAREQEKLVHVRQQLVEYTKCLLADADTSAFSLPEETPYGEPDLSVPPRKINVPRNETILQPELRRRRDLYKLTRHVHAIVEKARKKARDIKTKRTPVKKPPVNPTPGDGTVNPTGVQPPVVTPVVTPGVTPGVQPPGVQPPVNEPVNPTGVQPPVKPTGDDTGENIHADLPKPVTPKPDKIERVLRPRLPKDDNTETGKTRDKERRETPVKTFLLKHDVKPTVRIARTVFTDILSQMFCKRVMNVSVDAFKTMCEKVHENLSINFSPGENNKLVIPDVVSFQDHLGNDFKTYLGGSSKLVSEKMLKLLNNIYIKNLSDIAEIIRETFLKTTAIEATFRNPITPGLNNALSDVYIVKKPEKDGQFFTIMILFISLYDPSFFRRHPLHASIHMLYPALRSTKSSADALSEADTFDLNFGGGESEGFRRKFNRQVQFQLTKMGKSQRLELENHLRSLNTLLTPNVNDWSLLVRSVILMRYIYQKFDFTWTISKPPVKTKNVLDVDEAFE